MTIVAIVFFAYWLASTLYFFAKRLLTFYRYLYSSGTLEKSPYSPFAEVKWDT